MMIEKPKRTREKTIWDECKALERRRAELQASVALHEENATMARMKLQALIAETPREVVERCTQD